MDEESNEVTLALLKKDLDTLKTMLEQHDRHEREQFQQVWAVVNRDHDRVIELSTTSEILAGDIKALQSQLSSRTLAFVSAVLGLATLMVGEIAAFFSHKGA